MNRNFFSSNLFLIFPLALACFFYGCRSTENLNATENEQPVLTSEQIKKEDGSLLLLFAGDIMAHGPNYNMKDFHPIWEDVKDIVQESDLSFANLESPVMPDQPYESYPTFNMKAGYPQAAIDSGFNVFSLANNHTNDHKYEGIVSTCRYFAALEEKTKNTDRPVYACGIKEKAGPLTYRVIECRGWKILFVAVTEILNKPYFSSFIDFENPVAKSRAAFIENIIKLRQENPCDVFVMSIHASDEEYIRTIRKSQRDFYLQLLDNGVDIVWANHAHVAKDWELIQNTQTGTSKMIFHAQGNTISAQRYRPNLANPAGDREYTGEGFLTQIKVNKHNGGIFIDYVNPVLITTFINDNQKFVVKKLDDNFIKYLEDNNYKRWAKYLSERKTLMENTKGTTIWQ